MNKQGEVRDWQLDMERCKDFTSMESKSVYIKALEYWLQQYATEKEQTELWREHVRKSNIELEDAEAREKKLREAIEGAIPDMLPIPRILLKRTLDSLYPKEEEAK